MVDGVLHNECPVFAVSSCIQRAPSGLVEEAHSGQFAEQFSKKRIYEILRKKSVMCADIRRHCHSSRSLVCVSCKGTSRTLHPPLQPISVGGPFHCVGVDILQLPLTEAGNHCHHIPGEASATPNQTAETIVHLLVNDICCRYGALQHLLSKRDANFFSISLCKMCANSSPSRR